MKDYEYPPLALPVSENFGDLMLAGGINDMNSAFDIPNSEGKEDMRIRQRVTTLVFYCADCSHHVTRPVRDGENPAEPRVEKCGSCSGSGQPCAKCIAERKARRPKTEAA